MKKYYYCVIALLSINATLFAQIKQAQSNDATVITMDSVETLSDDEIITDIECISGGSNASQCSFSGTILGVSGECSVTCESGTYACCGLLGCHCKSK